MAHILVVEDDPDVASLLSHLLGDAGHEVTVAHDGAAGLAQARSRQPELIVLDWMMPELSGIDVCEALRADATFEATRIVMLTARTSDADRVRAEAAGADAFLSKPFSPRQFRSQIAELLA